MDTGTGTDYLAFTHYPGLGYGYLVYSRRWMYSRRSDIERLEDEGIGKSLADFMI